MRKRVHGPLGLDVVQGHHRVRRLQPGALGIGLTARAHGIFEASVFVVGALVVMCATLSVIVVKR